MSTIETPNFKEMSIGTLRQYAAHLKVAIAKTATKEDIIDVIERKLRGRVMPEIATESTQVKPGYAKIRINEDPTPGAANNPVYVNANGYVCTIPRGVDVVVPMRVIRTLNDAVARRKTQLESVPGKPINEVERFIQSYPFQILEMTPGPEPLTKLEEQKLKTIGPRRRYRDLFGRWPTPRDLVRAIEQRLIKMDEGEELSESTQKVIDTKSDSMIED